MGQIRTIFFLFVFLGISYSLFAADLKNPSYPVKNTALDKNLQAEVSIVPLEELKKIVSDLRFRYELALEFAEEGCFARAHLLAQMFEKKGINVGKFFAIAELDSFQVALGPLNKIEHWTYHVAPFVWAHNPETDLTEMKIIDFVLFDGPVSALEWEERLVKENKNVQYTRSFRSRFAYKSDTEWENLKDYEPQELKDAQTYFVNKREALLKLSSSQSH